MERQKNEGRMKQTKVEGKGKERKGTKTGRE